MKKFSIIFTPSEDLVTYTQPIIRTIISVIVIFIGIYRDRIFPDSLGLFANIMDIILFIISMIGTFNLYVIPGEFLKTFENRHDLKIKNTVEETDGTLCKLNDIVALCDKYDQVIVKILVDKNIYTVGSSGVKKRNSMKLFDKQFFIEEQEFVDVKDFKNALVEYSNYDMLRVLSVDDIDNPQPYIDELLKNEKRQLKYNNPEKAPFTISILTTLISLTFLLASKVENQVDMYYLDFYRYTGIVLIGISLLIPVFNKDVRKIFWSKKGLIALFTALIINLIIAFC